MRVGPGVFDSARPSTSSARSAAFSSPSPGDESSRLPRAPDAAAPNPRAVLRARALRGQLLVDAFKCIEHLILTTVDLKVYPSERASAALVLAHGAGAG